MSELDNRRLPNLLAKHPLLAPTATLEMTSLNAVEWKKPYTVLVQPAGSQQPRASVGDEPVLIELLAEKVADYNAMRCSDASIVTSLGLLEEKFGGTRGREQLLTSVRRLQNTHVSTHYAPYGERRRYQGTLLEQVELRPRGELKIQLSRLLMEQVARRQLLKPPGDYFGAKGLRRRIWALCLAFCGRDRASWAMPITELWRRSGSTNEPRKFIYAFRQLIAADEIPGYRLTMAEGQPQPVIIEHSDRSLDQSQTGSAPEGTLPVIYLDLGQEPDPPAPTIINTIDLF